MITIKLNGKDIKIKENQSIQNLLKEKNVVPATVTIQYNEKIIRTDKLNATILKNGDILEVIRIVGGG